MVRNLVSLTTVVLIFASKSAAQRLVNPDYAAFQPNVGIRVLPQKFYTEHLAFFCKRELEWQKKFALPVFFRLGTKDYVDRLERKPPFRRLH